MRKKSKIYKVGFELLIILTTITVATFAWFFSTPNLTQEEMRITTKAISDLLVSIDQGQTWHRDLSLNLPENFMFGKEITGNGVNFYAPQIKRPDGTPLTFQVADSTRDYLEVEVWFKSSANVIVYLDEKSRVNPLAGETYDDLLGPNVIRKSAGGNFTRDLIAGAVRIAFVENELIEGVYTPKGYTNLVWAPNKHIKVDCGPNVCNVDLNSTESQNYKYVDGADQAYYAEKDVVNLRDTLNVDYATNMANNDLYITHIPATDEANSIRSITIRIWIEGNDREANTSLTGGIFQMHLNFIGLSKLFNSLTPEVSVNNNEIMGFDSNTMEYSVDNGVTYSDIVTTFSNQTVYVRYKETIEALASNDKILEF
jgi:hypothetical protein